MSQLFTPLRRRAHNHNAVRTYVLLQRFGVPFEVERTVCSDCRRVLEERPLKRAAA
jgi:NMD protein affecting ribosome stability and mRNA decay